MTWAMFLELVAGLVAVLGLIIDGLAARLACVGVGLLALALLVGAHL